MFNVLWNSASSIHHSIAHCFLGRLGQPELDGMSKYFLWESCSMLNNLCYPSFGRQITREQCLVGAIFNFQPWASSWRLKVFSPNLGKIIFYLPKKRQRYKFAVFRIIMEIMVTAQYPDSLAENNYTWELGLFGYQVILKSTSVSCRHCKLLAVFAMF